MRIEFGTVLILIAFTNNRWQFLVNRAGWQNSFNISNMSVSVNGCMRMYGECINTLYGRDK